MRCKNCMTDVEEGTLFCPECGARMDQDSDKTVVLSDEDEMEDEPAPAPVPPVRPEKKAAPQPEASQPKEEKTDFVYCPNCGSKLESDAAFCGECGYNMKADQPKEPERAPEPVYTPPQPAPAKPQPASDEPEFSYCPNCGNRVEPDAAFCEFCGYNMKEETASSQPAPEPVQESNVIYCPNCGQKSDGSSMYCEACGARLDGKEEKKGKKAGGSSKGVKLPIVPIVAGVAGVAVVAAVGFLVIPKIFGGSSGDVPKELFYLKDDALYGVSLKNSKQEPVEYTDELGSGASRVLALTPQISKNGKYRFFIEDAEYDSNTGDVVYDLYYQKGKDDPERIESSVEGAYRLTDDNHVIYRKNGSLYVSDLKDKEKIDSDVVDFYIDEAEKNILWCVNAGDEFGYDLYYRDLAMKKDEVKIESDARIEARNGDMSKILLNKDGSLYLVKNQEESEKVASDVVSVYSVDLEKETFFYSTFVESTASAMDYVEDDLAASDAQITEPNRADYERQEPSYFGMTRTVVDDAYYDAMDVYEEKENRDWLRESLATQEIDNSYTELYYVAEGQETLVTDHLMDVISSATVNSSTREKNKDFGSYLLYTKVNPENVSVKFSQIESVGDVTSKVYESMSGEAETYVYAGGQEAAVDMDDMSMIDRDLDVKNNRLYLLMVDTEKGDTEGDLVSVSLASKSLGAVEEHDSDVTSLEAVVDGTLYYTKDVNDRGVGDLYRDGENVLSDVLQYSVEAIPDSSAVLCTTDPDRGSRIGTLTLLKKKGEGEELADGVYQFHAFDEKNIAILADYSENRDRGDLLYYKGKEPYVIDTDVTMFFAH